MKNKRSMIIVIAMVLLLAVVLGMGGTTFAKYITEMTPVSQSATVAKWGYTLSATTANLFGQSYSYNDVKGSTTTGAGTLTVKAASGNTKNVIAPGTTGSMTLNINGTAEVLSAFTINASSASDIALAAETVVINADPETKNAEYHPVIWNITGNASIGGDDIEGVIANGLTTAQLIANLNKLDDAASSLAPNTEIDIDLTLTWAWAFENAQAGANIMDTYLGAQATPQTLDLAITAQITQLDGAPATP